MRPGAAVLASVSLLVLAGGPAAGQTRTDRLPLPARMSDTGGGSQLVTARAARASATTGTVTWWNRRAGRWTRAGSAPARFGAGGLVEGRVREQGTNTTPTGLYDLPYAFGIRPAPRGTSTPYRRVRAASWWCQDNASRSYNRWTEPRPADCRAAESEHLLSYRTQYAYAFVVGFNYERPVRGRGAGIFLHVDGRGATAGCVSVPRHAMRRLLDWAEPGRRPHLAVGTDDDGPTSLTSPTRR